MKPYLFTALAAVMLTAAAGCRSHAPATETTDEMKLQSTRPLSFMPDAVIYKTNGDYNDNVPVTLNSNRDAVASYPAPSDLTADSDPIPLADGWLLDRRGITAKSVFTRYTYADYRRLAEAPSPRQLMDSVIPGARVMEIRALPMKVGEVTAADTAAVNRLITDSLSSLRLVFQVPVIHYNPEE